MASNKASIKDQRIDVGGMGGAGGGLTMFPESTYTAPGAIGQRTGDYGKIVTTMSGVNIGMSGAEVRELLTQTASLSNEAVSKVADYAQSALATAATAKTGESPTWQRYIPHILAAVVVMAMWRAHR